MANGEVIEVNPQNGMACHYEPEFDAPLLRLRLLCAHALVPALIGRKGENMKRIRRESGATVSVADPVLGCDERVVHVIGESVDNDATTSAADALCAVFHTLCALQQLWRGEPPTPSPSSTSPPTSTPPPASPTGAATEGATPGGCSTNGSIVDGHAEAGGSSAASTAGDHSVVSGTATGSTRSAARPLEVRLLVDASVVGFIVGKGGATIKDTMAKSGAGVRVLPHGELPSCAHASDEVLRVVGSADAVTAALRLLAAQIKAHTLRHGEPQPAFGYPGPLPPLMVGHMPPPDMAFMPQGMPPAGFYPPGAALQPAAAAYSGAAVEVTFRLLAPVSRTGNIIGKGGEHVRRVRTETGARIKVFDPSHGSEERVVALTSLEDALSPYCAAQDALIRCAIALIADDAPTSSHRVRLLTAQASVGMVLGKRGATVSQLRQETGASIKVLPADPVPPAFGGGLGAEDFDGELGSGLSSPVGGNGTPTNGHVVEEVIQLEGPLQSCVAALRGVATLLRGWQIRRLVTAQQHQLGNGLVVSTAMLQQPAAMPPMPLSPTAPGVMSPSSPGILGVQLPSSLSSPAQPGYIMSPVGPPGGMGPPGMLPQGMMVPGPPPLPAQPRGLTFVYHLNNAQVGAVLGKGGAHIAQIRSATGARVQLQEDGEGGGRVMLVAGLPEQCHAAHTMANAFLSMGRCEAAFPEPLPGI